MLVECIKNNDLEQMGQLWNQRQAHAVVGVSVTKNRDGKTMLQGLCFKNMQFFKFTDKSGRHTSPSATLSHRVLRAQTFILKSQIKARDSDGPDRAIDLNRPTYEQIHRMIFNGDTQKSLVFKPMNELKLEIKNIQALNIKG